MKRLKLIPLLVLAGCAGNTPEIKRLSPATTASKPPVQCQIVSLLKDSPAEKAGLAVGDVIKSVNGQSPADASVLSDIVGAAPDDSDFEIVKIDGTSSHVKIHLNSGRPRLGSVCDLAGWEKPGVTTAGNESLTVFAGPYALTVSGIIDKGVVFARVRLSNNSDKPLEAGPALFSATDGSGAAQAILSPKDVMCYLYGDKGAHLLGLKKKQKDTLDSHESVPSAESSPDEHCPWGTKGHMSSADPQFIDANAQYVATESLWPSTYQPGNVADGLIYMKEPTGLPVTLTASLDGRTLMVKLGHPVGKTVQMKRSELVAFFESQKKGAQLRLTLRKGQVFVGKFASYDSLEERVWFNTPSGGMLNTTSYSVENIRFAEPLEQVPAKAPPTSGDLN